MRKAIISYILCIMMVFSMVPVFSFAAEGDGTDAVETPETTQPAEAEGATETVEPTEANEAVPEANQAESEVVLEAKDNEDDDGDDIDPGMDYFVSANPGATADDNVSRYGNSMRIYGIYLRRANGSVVTSDRFGDAVLIESNGKYLLMDTGSIYPIKGDNKTCIHSSIVGVLKNIGVKELDVYISHLHGDHTGGLKDICNNFTVNRLYLPDLKLCEKYHTPAPNNYSIESRYAKNINIAKDKVKEIIFLKPPMKSHKEIVYKGVRYAPDARVISGFSVGAVSFSVVGPVGTYSVEQFASQDGDCGSKEGHYLNNCSLITIAQCGNFRFLSAGDAEKQEESNLVNTYGYNINCDVMKLSHHGLKTSNTSSFLANVTPMWSFAENHGYYSSSDGSAARAMGYGYNSRVASNRHSFIMDVQNNNARIYVDSNDNSKLDEYPLTSWVAVKKDSKHIYYQFYDWQGYIQLGWNDVSGDKYFMNTSNGFRVTGTHMIYGVKCTFDKYGKLTDPKKPGKTKATSIKAKKKKHKITVKWKKVKNASGYQVFRSTSKKSGYVLVSTRSKKSKSYTNSGLKKGKTYYYRVRAVRYIAGTTLYGPFSKTKKIKAK